MALKNVVSLKVQKRDIVLFLAALSLLLITFHYNEGYWLTHLYESTLSQKHRILLYASQVVGVGLALSLVLFRKVIYRRWKELLLFSILVLTPIIFLGILSEVYICNFAPPELQLRTLLYGQCGFKPRLSPHHYLNHHGTPNFISLDGADMHNSMGFRGPEIQIPKPEGVYRIATLGGSTTYSAKVKSWKKDFARQLEKELQEDYNYSKIEVINAGIGGYNSWESLINLEFKVLDTEPDMIIIYHGLNDVHARLVRADSYKGDDSGRRRPWDASEVPLILRPTLVRLVTGINPHSSLSSLVNAPTTPGKTQETGFLAELNDTPFGAIQKNPPVFFERNLQNMIAIAKEHDIDVLLATWTYTTEFPGLATTSYYEVGIAENNEVVKEVGLAQGSPVYDFAAEMPIDKRYWAEGVHLNEEGVKLKAELFANFIKSKKLLDEKFKEVRDGKQ